MKKIFLCLAAFLLFTLIAYNAFFFIDRKNEKAHIESQKQITRLNAAELEAVKEGDFILRRGFGYFSDFISKNLNTGSIDVTHAGIIVKQGDTLCVIHSLSSDVSEIDGIQMQPLSEFLKYSSPNKIIITQVKNCDSLTGSKIAVLAKKYLSQNIPFDHSGKYDDDTELYCTELIWKILDTDLKCVTTPSDPDMREKFFYTMTPMYDTLYFDIKVNQYNQAAIINQH